MPANATNTEVSHTRATAESDPVGFRLGPGWSCVLDRIADGISVHSGTTEIVWANKRMCDLYGRTLGELKGLPCEQIFHRGADCRHEEVIGSGRGIEFRAQLSGQVISVSIEPLRGEEGQGLGFVRIVSVGADRALVKQLREAERLASLGQLLAGIAHSVGTPLNIISGYSEFLLMHIQPDEPGHKELTAILDQTRRIAGMFGEALDMARPAQGRRDLLELKSILSSTMDLAAHHFRKADVRAELTCRISPPLIYGEAAQLKQAFFNLMVIAAERLGPGGRLEIEVDGPQQRPGFSSVELRGTEGTGGRHDFSLSLRSLVDAELSGEAIGLFGLTLVRGILESMGAQLEFGAAGECGVPFIIHWPASGAIEPVGR